MNRCSDDQNVLSALVSREYCHKNNYRKNLRIMRTLVCRGNYKFQKVWEQSSKHLISCESNTVFMNNYRTGYGGYGLHRAAPVHQLSISQEKMPRKIVDAILSRSRPTEICTKGPCSTGKPGNKLYGITSSSLLVIDLRTGRIIFEVLMLLSRNVKFKHINWLQMEESVVLMTTLCPRPSPNQRRPAGQGPSNLVKTLAVFKVMPLMFVCMFEVTRDVFGADVTDVTMCQGLLIIMHQSRLVRFYDFDHLLREHQIEPQLLRNCCYGESAPLSTNLKITDLPRCLFEIKCEECNVQMGGHPWHYLISPVGSKSCFSVYALDSGVLAQNGTVEFYKDSIELDRMVFHSDESSRIIHIGPEEVRVFWLKQEDGGSVLSLAFTITLQYSPVQNAAPAPVTTSSGRTVKQRYCLDEIRGEQMCMTIHEVDYEDELDVMMVCHTMHQPNALQGVVGLYDNTSGRHLISVKLDEPWPDYSEHNVSLDKDTIIHIVKSINGKFMCQVYRLFERHHDEDCGPMSGSELQSKDAPLLESSTSDSLRLPTPRRQPRGRR